MHIRGTEWTIMLTNKVCLKVKLKTGKNENIIYLASSFRKQNRVIKDYFKTGQWLFLASHNILQHSWLARLNNRRQLQQFKN